MVRKPIILNTLYYQNVWQAKKPQMSDEIIHGIVKSCRKKKNVRQNKAIERKIDAATNRIYVQSIC